MVENYKSKASVNSSSDDTIMPSLNQDDSALLGDLVKNPPLQKKKKGYLM